MKVCIIIGSKSDKGILKESGMVEVFKAAGVPFSVSVFSAHRNPTELEDFCDEEDQNDNHIVFICAAGMAAALPGTVAVILRERQSDAQVIGVPLPSEEYPDCRDALLSMIRMPSRMPVLVPGIGKSGLVNAAVAACRMVSWARCGREGNVEGRLNKFLDEKTAKPEQDIDLNAQEAEK